MGMVRKRKYAVHKLGLEDLLLVASSKPAEAVAECCRQVNLYWCCLYGNKATRCALAIVLLRESAVVIIVLPESDREDKGEEDTKSKKKKT